MLKIFNRLHRWYWTALLCKRVGSLHWARVMYNYGRGNLAVRANSSGALVASPIHVNLTPGRHDFVLEGWECAHNLAKAGARFRVAENGDLRVTIDEISVPVLNKEDLFILGEMHVAGSYELEISGEVLILDVGMNVGHASLYFARKMPQARIVAFEPLKPTFERAQRNLGENPTLASRIEAKPFGLADADGSFEIDYADAVPGLASMYGLPEHRKAYLPTRKEKLVVRDAAAAFDEATAGYPNRTIVMKIDCEGAEYRILDRLIETGKLARVQVLMIEWHRLAAEHDPKKLASQLHENGFVCVLQDAKAADAGMLYAVRTSASQSSTTRLPAIHPAEAVAL